MEVQRKLMAVLIGLHNTGIEFVRLIKVKGLSILGLAITLK